MAAATTTNRLHLTPGYTASAYMITAAVIAGPLNHLGVNPKVTATARNVPQPSP